MNHLRTQWRHAARSYPNPSTLTFWHGTTADLRVGEFIEAGNTIFDDPRERANLRSPVVRFYSILAEEEMTDDSGEYVWVTTDRRAAATWALLPAKFDEKVYVYRVELPNPDDGYEGVGPVLNATTSEEWVAPWARILEKGPA